MLSQKQELKLTQKLSPRQILLMKLLQIPTVSLEQRIKQELEDNPALEIEEMEDTSFQEESDNSDEYADDSLTGEEDALYDAVRDLDEYFYEDDDIQPYRENVGKSDDDDNMKEIPYAFGESFQENLRYQLGMYHLPAEDLKIAEYILGNIDESGYLQRTAKEMVNDLLFNLQIVTTQEKVQSIINNVIHSLDPAGVGALNLQECLLLQLKRMKETKEVVLAKKIIKNYFNEFKKKHYEKIIQRLKVTQEELDAALSLLLKLDPKPGVSSNDIQREAAYISPDFIVYINEKDGSLNLTLPNYNIPELRVKKAYAGLYNEIKDKKTMSQEEKKAALDFVKQKVVSAEWFIDSITQREATLYRTMQSIIDYQIEFFQTGDETYIKPMVLKDIADRVEMDISTISRVVSSKYVLTPYGLYPLKFFFSESMQTNDGGEVSSREVKKILSDAIDNEDKQKPYTDDMLCKILNKKGYNIARRTVTKYREQLGIPVARMRK
ncbi:MAG TPA: RNA polymerase factor sigma-54 [Bacteroidales bacterium]|nr:RNA polymerase factor sigma-54 [Bacteroidales bacterium]